MPLAARHKAGQPVVEPQHSVGRQLQHERGYVQLGYATNPVSVTGPDGTGPVQVGDTDGAGEHRRPPSVTRPSRRARAP
jgi:hypothetical protein